MTLTSLIYFFLGKVTSIQDSLGDCFVFRIRRSNAQHLTAFREQRVGQFLNGHFVFVKTFENRVESRVNVLQSRSRC